MLQLRAVEGNSRHQLKFRVLSIDKNLLPVFSRISNIVANRATSSSEYWRQKLMHKHKDRRCESNQAHHWLHCSINKSLYSFAITKFSTLGWPVGIILSSKPSPYISYYKLPIFLVVLQVHFGEADKQNASVKDKGDNEEVQAEVAEDYKDLGYPSSRYWYLLNVVVMLVLMPMI